MSNLVLFEAMTNKTVSTASRFNGASFIYTTAATLATVATFATLSLSPVDSTIKSGVNEEELAVRELIVPDSMGGLSSHYHLLQIDDVHDETVMIDGDLPPFTLEWINAEIESFMALVDSDEVESYSDELIALAEKVIEENPQAFKSFL